MSPEKDLWHCSGACQTGSSVIEIMTKQPSANQPGRLKKIATWLERPGSMWAIALFAVALLLPSLGNRLTLDDHVLSLMLRDDPGIRGFRSNPLDLFTFTSGDPRRNRELMDEGALLPWWSDESHLNAFFRPLSSLTHRLDFALWPRFPILMHLHSIAWFGALLFVVGRLYRSLCSTSRNPGWLAGFSFLIFALDDAHGQTVGWIANRNALVAATFALSAFGFHHRFRAERRRTGALLGPVFFAFALLAGESAISVFGFLLAYALFIDRGGLKNALASLSGFAIVVACWLAIHKGLNLGSFASGAYHDPAREPLGFLAALCRNLPILLSAQLGFPTADLAFWGPPRLWPPLMVLSLATIAAFSWLALGVITRDSRARFWALGTVLAAVPVSSSVPGERLLLMVGFGASPLLAGVLLELFDANRPSFGFFRARSALLYALVAVHLVLAPVLLPIRAYSMNLLGRVIDRADQSIPRSRAIRDRTVIIVNTPFDVMSSYIQVMRESRRQPRPRHLYWLSTASSPVKIARVAFQTLEITPREGFVYTPLERHYRGNPGALVKGSVVALSEMSVRITETTRDGRPRSARFTFASPLDCQRYLFLAWSEGKYIRFIIPDLGEQVTLPGAGFFDVVFSSIFSR